ncbi:putative Prepilin-type N-terminal cleavage/methylation domain protein [Vibrio coralliirubri]|uniref:type IV pilin protein n=1 Tax=Vibrio coralliirubri TaxID=1516159 RepID=UPI00062E97EA|nr:prepilin-type N-terminal cleavage/methylation domain-containing protein [Vibrio coralliirubri]CDT34006.1 putative Prepilin-type N-terminal cleavage/methylation domain protein [Vibrio coralliirubri]
MPTKFHSSNLKQRKNTKAFTLIELVVVILLISILSVIALPKFLNFSSHAKVSALEGVEAALKNAVNLVEAQALIDNKYNNLGQDVKGTKLTFNDNTITIYNKGTPREVWNDGFEHLISGDFNHIGTGTGVLNEICTGAPLCVIDNLKISNVISGKEGYGLFIFPRGHKLTDKECFTHYGFQIDSNGLLVYRETGVEKEGC